MLAINSVNLLSNQGETKMSLLKRAVLMWLGLFGLAFVNGALREVVFVPIFHEPLAHQLSAATALALFTAVVWGFWNRLGIHSYADGLLVGGFWFVLTILVETFLLNRWMGKLSWQQIGRSYDLTRGELWPLVLIGLALLPLVVRRYKGSP